MISSSGVLQNLSCTVISSDMKCEICYASVYSLHECCCFLLLLMHGNQTIWATVSSWVSAIPFFELRSNNRLHPGGGEAGLTVQSYFVLTDSPTTTHRNLTSSSLNDISDKPEKDQVSQPGLYKWKTSVIVLVFYLLQVFLSQFVTLQIICYA